MSNSLISCISSVSLCTPKDSLIPLFVELEFLSILPLFAVIDSLLLISFPFFDEPKLLLKLPLLDDLLIPVSKLILD